MDSASAVFLILILLLIALFAFGFWNSARAKRQHETVVTLSPARVRQIVDSTFSKVLWADADGPGDINKRRRTLNNSGATVSIDINQTADGKTLVQAWMSGWKTRYGMVASGGWELARKVINKLEQAQG